MVPKLMQGGTARDRHASPASGSLNSPTRLSAARQRQMSNPYTDGAKQMENSAELDELDVRDSTKTKGEMPIEASGQCSCRDLQSAADGQVYICSCLLCVIFAANLRCWAVRSSSTLQASSCLQDHPRTYLRTKNVSPLHQSRCAGLCRQLLAHRQRDGDTTLSTRSSCQAG